MSDFSIPKWNEALREFFLQEEATHAPKTVRYYRVQLGTLAAWAEANATPFEGFGKRHLDRYIVERQRRGFRHGFAQRPPGKVTVSPLPSRHCDGY
jgi:site-specific recombinase XerD